MWNEIKNENDIENLMNEYAGFHDSCIVSIKYTSGNYVYDSDVYGSGMTNHKLSMILHSPWRPPVQLMFTGVRKCNIVGWDECFWSDIYGAYLAFHTELLGRTRDDRLIVWADNWFDPADYIEEKVISRTGRNITYIIAENLCWRYLNEDN